MSPSTGIERIIISPSMSQDCIFCQISAGKAPASLAYEDEQVFAILDLNQPVPYKTLVIPRAHVETVYDLTGEQAAAVMQAASRIARAVRDASGCDGLMVAQFNGSAAGQTVFHFHFHLVPRFWNDGLHTGWPRRPADRAELDRMAGEIRERLGS